MSHGIRVQWTTCEPCGKRAYVSRKDARKVKRPGLHAYECRHVPGTFHLGHLKGDVLAGHVARGDYYGPDGVGRIRHKYGRNTEGREAA